MIPKIIHYCWFGGQPLPQLVIKCIESWKKYCPDYQIIEWNESNYDITKNKYMKQAYDARKWSFVTDYARKDIIYEYGGIYLDTDVEIIKPINIFLNDGAFLGMEKPGIVASGLIIGAEKNNPLIKEMRDVYDDLSFINQDGTFNQTTCLEYENPILYAHGLKIINETQNIGDVIVYPTDYFCPKAGYGTDIKITPNTHTIHHYMASWVSPKNKIKGKIYFLLTKFFGKNFAEKIKNIFGKNNK